MITFAFTYETITPESAEHGDFDDHGFYVDGWHYSMTHDEIVKDSRENPEAYRAQWEIGLLRDTLETAHRLGIYEDCGNWFSSVDPDIDYASGEEKFYSLHVDGVTPATETRIARALKGENIYGRVMRDKDLKSLALHAYYVIANDTTLPEEHTTADLIGLLQKAFPKLCAADARALFRFAQAL